MADFRHSTPAPGANLLIRRLSLNGTTPFCDPSEASIEVLEQAHALTKMLKVGWAMAAESPHSSADHLATLSPHIIGAAMEGIGSLIALSVHLQSIEGGAA
jgi:hypothetical protein